MLGTHCLSGPGFSLLIVLLGYFVGLLERLDDKAGVRAPDPCMYGVGIPHSQTPSVAPLGHESKQGPQGLLQQPPTKCLVPALAGALIVIFSNSDLIYSQA